MISRWSCRRPPSSGASGYTLIELLVVIAIMVVLIGLLLPEVQAEREEHNAFRASGELRNIMAAATVFMTENQGTFPPDLATLVDFCVTTQRCLLELTLGTGQAHGYNFFLDRDAETAEAEPACPGVTGSKTLLLPLGGALLEVDTPGAEAARRRMLNEVFADGSVHIGKLIASDPESPAAIRSQPSPITGPQLSAVIDRDHNQMLSAGEIFLLSQPGDRTLPAFLEQAKTTMQLGKAGESWSLLLLPYIEQDNLYGLAFNYEFLMGLTQSFVEGRSGRLPLLALRIASRSPRLEGFAAGFYLRKLASEVHRSLTRTHYLALAAWISTIVEVEPPPPAPTP